MLTEMLLTAIVILTFYTMLPAQFRHRLNSIQGIEVNSNMHTSLTVDNSTF